MIQRAVHGAFFVGRALLANLPAYSTAESAIRLILLCCFRSFTDPLIFYLYMRGVCETFHARRLRARVCPSGEPVLLMDQNRGRWDQLLIRRGLAALERASGSGGALGPYALQAAIAACHARAWAVNDTNR